MSLAIGEEVHVQSEPAFWREWRETGSIAAREQLILLYTPWARSVARDVFLRVRGRGQDWPDFVQNASIGLLEAMNAFDPARGIPFTGYARLRVRGSVFNGLRSLFDDGGPHHEVQSYAERIHSLCEDAEADPVERLIDLVSNLGFVHLLQRQAEPEAAPAPSTPYDEAVRGQLSARLARLLAGLQQRERLVLSLHYLHHLPFVQVAEVLAVSKGRVSQMHRQALRQLREKLGQESFHQIW